MTGKLGSMYVRAVSSTTSSVHQNNRAADPEQAAGPKGTAGEAGPEGDGLTGEEPAPDSCGVGEVGSGELELPDNLAVGSG